MSDLLKLLRQHGLSELACQFAAYIDRKEQGMRPVVSITAALLSEAIAEGHVCLNLQQLPTFCQPLKPWARGKIIHIPLVVICFLL